MNTSEHTSYTVVPSGNFKCIWMTAGILSYQLCDRLYDCDSCLLDQAIRKHVVNHTATHTQVNPKTTGETLRDDCLYSTRHCWLKEVAPHRYRVGIEPSLARTFLAPKTVVLPLTGQRFKKDLVAVWIIYNEGIFPVYAPLDGEVTARNPRICDEPKELMEHPFETGWLYEIESEGLLPSNLMNSSAARIAFKLDSDKFKDAIMSAMQLVKEEKSAYSMATLADGGEPVQNVSEIIGKKRYLQLLIERYGRQ